MAYDFDTEHERRGTSCEKYDAMQTLRHRDDLLPLWVADMDFALPDEIVEDIDRVVRRGIYGYGFTDEAYGETVCSWYRTHFGWDCKGRWIVRTPGVVFALGVAIQSFTSPGDGVLIQQPVYYPFESLIRSNGRHLVDSELVYEDGRYHIDFEDFERKVVDGHVKLFILCSPHNPVGRVWSEEELAHMGRICAEHDVLIVSDEIHCDFTFPGNTHHMLPTVVPEVIDRCVICTSPSKTFNIAGLQVANIFIPDDTLRRSFRQTMKRIGSFDINIVAKEAARSVFTKGEAWYRQLLSYLTDNLSYTRAFIAERIPSIRLVEPEGTYLLWLDCSGLGLSDDEVDPFFVDKAHLWLDHGALFGTHSAQFERLNIACPHATLERALTQLEVAVGNLS